MGKPKKMTAGHAGQWMIPVSSTAPVPATVQSIVPSMASMPSMPSMPPMQPMAAHMIPPHGGQFDPLSATIMQLNTNPYLIGMFMLLLNLGGRFLSLELTKKQETFLQAPWIRPILFFTVIFIATRNLAVAFWITVFFFFVIWVVANENSPFCMIPSWCGHDIKGAKANYINNMQKLFY